MRLSVCWARCGSSRRSSCGDAIEFVEQLLEPQLVDLVDDDEEQLVVFGPVGARLLQREQLVELQIVRVGDGDGFDRSCCTYPRRRTSSRPRASARARCSA